MRWESEAACAGTDLDQWFPGVDDQAAANRAKDLCNTVCPVRTECLNAAVTADIRYGIYGGQSPKARDDTRRARNKENAA